MSLNPPFGDADLNHIVDFDDYSRIDNGFNNNMSGWANGDFDGNGVIDFDDYSLIDQAFNQQGGGAGTRAIPEPGALAMIMLASVVCLRRR
ncbi:MAG: PEP-CTERM sorting domain-containing protein [Anaerolineae bacterium]|nr:PEP-CTERM sorting domain-containing protein [Phycisphaerae bacterium]